MKLEPSQISHIMIHWYWQKASFTKESIDASWSKCVASYFPNNFSISCIQLKHTKILLCVYWESIDASWSMCVASYFPNNFSISCIQLKHTKILLCVYWESIDASWSKCVASYFPNKISIYCIQKHKFSFMCLLDIFVWFPCNSRKLIWESFLKLTHVFNNRYHGHGLDVIMTFVSWLEER